MAHPPPGDSTARGDSSTRSATAASDTDPRPARAPAAPPLPSPTTPAVCDGEPNSQWSRDESVSTMDTAARGLVDRRGDGVEHTLGLIVAGAVATVPAVAAGGISLIERGGEVRAYQPSSPAVDDLDQLQNELGQGPCLDAIHTERLVEIDDFATETRWPRFAAAERVIGSLVSFQLFTDTGSAGALNLYAATPSRSPCTVGA